MLVGGVLENFCSGRVAPLSVADRVCLRPHGYTEVPPQFLILFSRRTKPLAPFSYFCSQQNLLTRNSTRSGFAAGTPRKGVSVHVA